MTASYRAALPDQTALLVTASTTSASIGLALLTDQPGRSASDNEPVRHPHIPAERSWATAVWQTDAIRC